MIYNLLRKAKSKWEVTTISGAAYGFELNANGYYESNNKGVHNSAAVCRVQIHAAKKCTVTFKCINYAEENYDFGLLGTLDEEQNTGYSDTSTNVAKSFKGSSMSSEQTYSYTNVAAGDHFIDVKYRKDSSQSSNNDSLQFTVEIVQEKMSVPIYTWEKWNVVSNDSVGLGVHDTVTSHLGTEPITTKVPCFSSYTYSNGTISGSGSVGDKPINETGKYYFPYETSWYYDGEGRVEERGERTFYNVYAWRLKVTTTTSKGSTSYGTVTSTNASDYPTNGVKDGYWYVKKV